jgi:UDP-N-acetylmuramoylalanine--D-glutamate ligase
VTPRTRALVAGLGITGAAVAEVLVRCGHEVVVVEDHPREHHRRTAELLAVTLVETPTPDVLDALVAQADVAYPSPGFPDSHPLFAALARHDVTVRSEFDLAGELDDRPLVAVTGTDGKTTVVEMVTAMLSASGRRAAAVGNTETPLVAAIADEALEIFVVEASSFRLAHTHRFVPEVATWLNFGADHQDVHTSPRSYEAAKARLWSDLGPGAVVVANDTDPVVMAHVPAGPRVVTFGGPTSHLRRSGDSLLVGDEVLLGVEELSRSLPHDVDNALAAAATALAAGAAPDAVRSVLRSFRHPRHRVEWVAEIDGVNYYDDSKATTPHATLAALSGFERSVLVAGGRNKGLDLGVLRGAAERLRAVVAMGEAAEQIEAAFADVVPVERAADMDDAVAIAAGRARRGDTVLLSPACASFDRYRSYGERGDDFVRAVTARAGSADASSPVGSLGTDRPAGERS